LLETRNKPYTTTLANIKNMKQNIYHYTIFLFLAFIIGCSSEPDELNENETIVKLNLNSIYINSHSVRLNYEYTGDIQNVKLIWNNSGDVDLNNKIEEIILVSASSEITVNNLEQNQSYSFKLSGIYDDQIYYSEEVSIKTTEIKLLKNNKLLDYSIGQIDEIVKTNDGFLIFSPTYYPISSGEIIITKLDFDLNFQWKVSVNESIDGYDLFKGLISLENEEFLGIAQKRYFSHSDGLWSWSIYSFKFNNQGNILNTTNLSYDNTDNHSNTFKYDTSKFSNHNHLKLVVNCDSTYYNNNDNNYYKELVLDNNGELKSQRTIGSFDDRSVMWYLKYDDVGNLFNYGNIDIKPNDGLLSWNAWLEKYDLNNNLIWNENYGIYGGDDSADNILIDNDGLVIVGKNGHQNGFDGESKWIIKTNSNGELIWDFKETRKDFIYQGKDIIKDIDNGYISLFFDIYFPNSHVYNIVSVIKADINGNIIWKYYDGEDFNDDSFQPYKIFVTGEKEYTIFGIKEGFLWVKRIKVE
jgi:hypothetical protein